MVVLDLDLDFPDFELPFPLPVARQLEGEVVGEVGA